jgi:hypothetical protein
MTDDHRHDTGLDLQFLGNLVNAEWLPELPLRESSKIDIRYCVLADTKAEGAGEYVQHVATLRSFANDQMLNFREETKRSKVGHTHHNATLDMPRGKVRFSVLWIEKPEVTE